MRLFILQLIQLRCALFFVIAVRTIWFYCAAIQKIFHFWHIIHSTRGWNFCYHGHLARSSAIGEVKETEWCSFSFIEKVCSRARQVKVWRQRRLLIFRYKYVTGQFFILNIAASCFVYINHNVQTLNLVILV